MKNLFYSDVIPENDRFFLSSEESRHCLKVLRKQAGDRISVTDGAGNMYICKLLDNNLSGCALNIEQVEQGHDHRSFSLHLAVSLIKNTSRFEWFLEKATEIGIEKITPLICERTEKQFFKKERYQKLLVSALKQSGRTMLPALNHPVTLPELISSENREEQRFIAWCEEKPAPLLTDALLPGKNTLILIGPEGDFTREELKSATENGFMPVSLGVGILRTETAGIYSCVAFNINNQHIV